MISVPDFLKRAADRNGYKRDRFDEMKMPTDVSNICIFPFFGDLRSLFVLSSFLLHRIRFENKNSKYFILASWSGYQGLFPYVDEYWSFTDEAVFRKFYEMSEGMRNKSDLTVTYSRNFNEFFRDVFDVSEVQKYYNNGFTNLFFDKYKATKRFLPFVPSATIVGRDFTKELAVKPGYKIFLHPSIYCKTWSGGCSNNVVAKKEFWVELCKVLLDNNMTPVIWQNNLSYDLSDELAEKCIIVKENDVTRVLAAMRASNCVLDVCNGISRLALYARAPFLCVDERSRYNSTKEYEMDMLLGSSIPKNYIFTFATILNYGTPSFWSQDILLSIVKKLEVFLPEVDRDKLPTTAESYDLVPYDEFVSVNKKKKFGTRFIKVLDE